MISWKKVKGASGYEVYRSTKKNGKYKRSRRSKKQERFVLQTKS
ncbi:MAG: hypothetical protein ACLTTO_12520 [Lachnospiraceae bacterium]